MLWTNNPEVLRALHDERIRQLRDTREPRRRLLRLVAVETGKAGTTVR